MPRHCLALDLKDDPQLIKEYKRYHSPDGIWPEITQSLKDSGILEMQIYLTGNRLFMIMEVADDFSFEKKTAMDDANPRVQAWEELMWKFQQALPWAKAGEKWILMEEIFSVQFR